MDTYDAWLLYVELMQHVCTPACSGGEMPANKTAHADTTDKDNTNHTH